MRKRILITAFAAGVVFLAGCYLLVNPGDGFSRSLPDLPYTIQVWLEDVISPPAAASEDALPVLLGLYTSDSLQVTNWELENFDRWLAENGVDARITIAGTYMDLEYLNPDWNVHQELDAAWELGYTPFVNLTAYQQKAYQVAFDPAFEERIRVWAAAFARWSQGGKKRAFIAPLQEMNGGWVRYGLDPVSFKHAWLKIQRIFREEGVAEEAVSWVFAPNAWSEPEHAFERYYPGDPVVDVVAFSTMNFGSCPDYESSWDTFETIYEPYLDRMRAMAPGKPIFLSQTGSVEVGPEGPDHRLKDRWIRDTYAKLAAYPGVRAILYYNIAKSEPAVTKCRPIDWRVYDKHHRIEYRGFLDAVRSPRFVYWAPESKQMDSIVFDGRPSAAFADVVPAHPLTGKDFPWYADWVEALAKAKIAPGCTKETFNIMERKIQFEYFCPQETVTRADLAHFIVLATHGKGFTPPPATGVFTDVPADHPDADWIEQLYQDGLAASCGANRYCPDEPVTRAQMALTLVKARYWPKPVQPPQGMGTYFEDVPRDHWAVGWIERISNAGITAGCETRKFCPQETVSRAELAVFIVKAFEIQLQEGVDWVVER